MSETIRCPDCGHENPAGSESCEKCGFPLVGAPGATSGPGAAAPSAPGATPAGQAARPTAPSAPSPMPPPRFRPIRPRRPRPVGSQQALSLWLVFASFCALAVIYVAVKANFDRASQPVEGSNAQQQQRADQLRAALEKDSTDVAARIELANILFDTANWPEAIVHYRAALRRDSTLTSALVDLGVCYYNLGEPEQAETYFRLALARDPHQPVALFNLGIVYERRQEYDKALQYFHRALQSGPPERMRQPLIEAMQRVQQKSGAKPPPLPGGG